MVAVSSLSTIRSSRIGPTPANGLSPLKGYSDIVWERPKSRKRPREVDHPELFYRRIRSARASVQ